MPLDVYRQKRTALLTRFLDRPALYATPALHRRFEAQARRNLSKTISAA